VVLASGKSAFVKIGATPGTAASLRSEREVFERLKGRFMPELLAWSDGDRPTLILEDLSGEHWPPPWKPEHVEAVIAALADLHSTKADLKPFAAAHADFPPGWSLVAKDPIPFLSLNLASAEWLERALPTLIECEAHAKTEGDSPTHWDVRSDNLCLSKRGAVLIDWNGACLSNPKLDMAFWLPSLVSEGGPLPENLLPDFPEGAAFVSGFFALYAGLPPVPGAPGVRGVQLEQLKPALAWAIRAMDLPPL
jgi:Ser/Thr protein kinase RdoA (MazF antagonist)